MAADRSAWPSLPLAEWQATHDPLYVTARGLTTSPMPYGTGAFEVAFDFTDHRLVVETSDGAIREMALRPQTVADFYREYVALLAGLGISVKLWPVPVEIDNPIPF